MTLRKTDKYFDILEVTLGVGDDGCFCNDYVNKIQESSKKYVQ